MPRVERAVVRLADRPARGIELRERLRQAHEVLEVAHLGVTSHVALADERRSIDRREDHVVGADPDAVLRIPGLELELARRLGDLLEDELGVELDHLPVDLLSRPAELLDRLLHRELDAELGDDAPPTPVERFHRVTREDLVARQGVLDHRSLLRVRDGGS